MRPYKSFVLPLLPLFFLAEGCERLLCFQVAGGEKWKAGLFINVLKMNAFMRCCFPAILCLLLLCLYTPPSVHTKPSRIPFEIVFIPFERRGAANAGSKQTVCLISAVSSCFLSCDRWRPGQQRGFTEHGGMTMTRIKRRNATRREGSSLRWPPTLWEHGSFST